MIEPTNLSTPMTEPDLLRFVNAQAQVYSRVIEELTNGRKRSHWIWFIFPQLAGLGHSATAQGYAIRDLEQARRYLADPILGARLRDDVRRMIGHKDRSALEILGSPDDLKFRSCLICFGKQLSKLRTECCSPRLWINSMMASRILARLNCWAERCPLRNILFCRGRSHQGWCYEGAGLPEVLGSAPGCQTGEGNRDMAPCRA